jgi:hypothetical protein
VGPQLEIRCEMRDALRQVILMAFRTIGLSHIGDGLQGVCTSTAAREPEGRQLSPTNLHCPLQPRDH